MTRRADAVRSLGAGVVSALVGAATLRVLSSSTRLPGGGPSGFRSRWDRTNHAGSTLTLLEGPAAAAGLIAGLAVAPVPSGRLRAAGITAVAGAAAIGAWDDLAETGTSKGLRGHLGALRQGRVTTGTLKIAGLGLAGLAASVLAGPGPVRRGAQAPRATVSPAGRVVDLLLGAGVVAGAANVVNLFDLRPGRSLKVVLLTAPTGLGGPAAGIAATCTGAAVGVLPADLGERSMLGDTGANAFGAALGCAVLAAQGRRGRAAVLALLTGLTLASEKVSFSRVIAATPGLRELDALGRRPR